MGGQEWGRGDGDEGQGWGQGARVGEGVTGMETEVVGTGGWGWEWGHRDGNGVTGVRMGGQGWGGGHGDVGTGTGMGTEVAGPGPHPRGRSQPPVPTPHPGRDGDTAPVLPGAGPAAPGAAVRCPVLNPPAPRPPPGHPRCPVPPHTPPPGDLPGLAGGAELRLGHPPVPEPPLAALLPGGLGLVPAAGAALLDGENHAGGLGLCPPAAQRRQQGGPGEPAANGARHRPRPRSRSRRGGLGGVATALRGHRDWGGEGGR